MWISFKTLKIKVFHNYKLRKIKLILGNKKGDKYIYLKYNRLF